MSDTLWRIEMCCRYSPKIASCSHTVHTKFTDITMIRRTFFFYAGVWCSSRYIMLSGLKWKMSLRPNLSDKMLVRAWGRRNRKMPLLSIKINTTSNKLRCLKYTAVRMALELLFNSSGF